MVVQKFYLFAIVCIDNYSNNSESAYGGSHLCPMDNSGRQSTKYSVFGVNNFLTMWYHTIAFGKG